MIKYRVHILQGEPLIVYADTHFMVDGFLMLYKKPTIPKKGVEWELVKAFNINQVIYFELLER